MVFKVLWDEGTVKELSAIGRVNAETVVDKVENYLSQNPLKLGESLKGSFEGFYRYRVGKCRVIYEVNIETEIVTVLRVGFRKDIYKG
ncbi:type II toxin-antitoxin system RelE family toxin [Candidatus Magnetomonas plexicatena]|uniref:type II toxin-antitoxin system RelE family toxin n=1 Tax=Candidatus Magnetomonas plexicatena TaxID=2552947 RepID=UPI001C773CE4|nr:type II toxin-antitoxin system RelE/ParE family toxin [Nitrospirales bacterium LBB_01]